MLESGKISGRQAVYLIIVTIFPTTILLLPHLVYGEARQDAWLSVILVTFFGVIVGEIIGRLGTRFPEQTVIGISRTLLGPVAGFFVGLLFPAAFIYINSIIVREFGELLITNFIPGTPVAVTLCAIVLTAIYIVSQGLEVLSRVNDMVLPLLFVMIFVILGLVFPFIKTENLMPVLERGFVPVVRGAVPAGVFFAETFIMLMLTPYLTKPGEARRVITRGILTVGFLQLIMVLVAITCFGAQTAYILFPALELARTIRLEFFLTNVDPVILLIWILGGTMKISVFLYCSTLTVAQLLGLRKHKWVVVFTGITTLILSIAPYKSSLSLADHFQNVGPLFIIPIQVGVPLLLLVIAVVTRKGMLKE